MTIDGKLRGCIGTLDSYQPLVMDVVEHAEAAALKDFRFPMLQPDEVEKINIEISYLTEPTMLEYSDPEDLVRKLRPGVDGVVLRYGSRRATFLPQVWEKIATPGDFLDHLCFKMNLPPKTWRVKHLEVLIYQVETFNE